MLFGDVVPDPNIPNATLLVVQLIILVTAVGSVVTNIIIALKSQANGVKADKAISQNEEILKQGNGMLASATQVAHDLGFKKGMIAAQAASVETVASAVAIGVAAAKKAELDKPTTQAP